MREINSLMYRILALFLVPLVCIGSDLQIGIVLPAEICTLGNPIPMEIEIRNTGSCEMPFDETMLTIELTWQNGEETIMRKRLIGATEAYFIKRNGQVRLEQDLNELFSIREARQYNVEVLYRLSMTVFNVQGGIETQQTRVVDEVRSRKARFTVTPLDGRQIARIESLLLVEEDNAAREALGLLAATDRGIYRHELPSLWAVVRTGRQPVKNQALKLFLDRIDLADERIPDDELFYEFAIAAANPDPSIRIAAAEAISRLYALGARRQSLFFFVGETVPKWFDRETSPVCRKLLVGYLPILKPERLVEIIRKDTDPQVRAAAIKRLTALDPRLFLEYVETFGDLDKAVSIEGQSLSLRSLLEREKSMILQTLPNDSN